MGGSSSKTEETRTKVVSSDKRETTVGFSAIPFGAKLEGERRQVPCPDGHHALRDGGDVLFASLEIVSKQPVIFCQTCMGHYFADDLVCKHFCDCQTCIEFAKTQPGGERFYCFLGPYHEGKHVCANCPTKSGCVGAGVTAEEKSASDKMYLEYMKAKLRRDYDVLNNPAYARFAHRDPIPMAHFPNGMMCQVTKVGRLTEFNTSTTSSTTVRTKESTFSSSISIDSYTHTCSFYLEFVESRRTAATMHNGVPMLGPGQGTLHKQLTDTVQGQVANNINQSEVVIKQKKSFLHESWTHRCVNGTHFGAVMFNAACTGREYRERHFVDYSQTGQVQARLIVRTPVVCCIACGVTTTLLYQPEQSKFKRNWQWNKVSGAICSGANRDWVPTIENIVTDAEAAREPTLLLGSILTMGTVPGRLFTDAEIQGLFPTHTAVIRERLRSDAARTEVDLEDSCDRGYHVFGACTYSTRTQSRVQTLLETRQEYHRYEKSSYFSIVKSVRSTVDQKGFTRFAAIVSKGTLTVAVHKCLYCNASKADPTDELEMIATDSAQDLIMHPLPSGFDISEGFASPVVMNLARECSMSEPSPQLTDPPPQPPGTSVGGTDATPGARQTDLPTLIQFLDAIPDATIGETDKLAIFTALHGMGYYLALLARKPKLEILQLGVGMASVAQPVWVEFVQQVVTLGYCGQEVEE